MRPTLQELAAELRHYCRMHEPHQSLDHRYSSTQVLSMAAERLEELDAAIAEAIFKLEEVTVEHRSRNVRPSA